jgi:hypothetical protein
MWHRALVDGYHHFRDTCSFYLPTRKRREQIFFFFQILVCEAIGTAATPGLLCQSRVILKMIVEKQMECRLAAETEVLGENLSQRHFCPSQNPKWPDLGLNPDRRCGKPATNRLSYCAAKAAGYSETFISAKVYRSEDLKSHTSWRFILWSVWSDYKCGFIYFWLDLLTSYTRTTRDYTLQITVTLRVVSSVTIDGFSDFVHRPDSKKIRHSLCYIPSSEPYRI